MINVSCCFCDDCYRININDGLHRVGTIKLRYELVEDKDFSLADLFEAIYSSMNEVRSFVHDDDEFPF